MKYVKTSTNTKKGMELYQRWLDNDYRSIYTVYRTPSFKILRRYNQICDDGEQLGSSPVVITYNNYNVFSAAFTYVNKDDVYTLRYYAEKTIYDIAIAAAHEC